MEVRYGWPSPIFVAHDPLHDDEALRDAEADVRDIGKPFR